MIDTVLFGLPTWVVITGVLASCVLAVVGFACCVCGGMADDRIERMRERHVAEVEARMVALNRRDVHDRRTRES
jgi:hypothetical protein